MVNLSECHSIYALFFVTLNLIKLGKSTSTFILFEVPLATRARGKGVAPCVSSVRPDIRFRLIRPMFFNLVPARFRSGSGPVPVRFWSWSGQILLFWLVWLVSQFFQMSTFMIFIQIKEIPLEKLLFGKSDSIQPIRRLFKDGKIRSGSGLVSAKFIVVLHLLVMSVYNYN